MGSKLSVVVPLYNEAEVIEEFCRRLELVLSGLDMQSEVILVDDGSSDETWALIEQVSLRYSNVRGVRLSRNFGHQRALMAGLGAATGDAIAMMDGDLQHPPELIPRLVASWQEGYHIVNTIRTNTPDVGFLKKNLTATFYSLINRISEVPITPNAADFRLVDRTVVEELKKLREHTVFLRGLMNWVGFSQTSVEFEADRRFGGQTKYSLARMFRLALAAIVSFSTHPLRLAVYSGAFIFSLSWLYGLWAIYAKFVAHLVVPGWTSIVWLIMLAASIQLFVLGVIAEYIAQIYEETKGRPLFIIQQNVGFPLRTSESETPAA
ncbi:MAG: glycosyltransferase family 2 protein [Armatimonadia bacterium]